MGEVYRAFANCFAPTQVSNDRGAPPLGLSKIDVRSCISSLASGETE